MLGQSWGCQIQAAFVTPFGQATVSNGIRYKALKEKEEQGFSLYRSWIKVTVTL